MKFVPNQATQFVARHSHNIRQNAPSTLFGLGVLGVTAGTVLACRATLKLPDELQMLRDEVESAKSISLANGKDPRPELARTYSYGAYRIAKIYGPSFILHAAGVACLTSSHRTLTARNQSLSMAYAALDAAYTEYRDRVREEVGEEKELDLYLGVAEVTEGRGEKKQIVKIVDGQKIGPYAKIFDQLSANWQPDPEMNMLFLRAQNTYLNDLLHARGHVFLNEVYDALDIPRTQAGQFVGWSLHCDGDNHIDLGIYDTSNARFVNGIENGVLLNPNVNGPITDYI